MLRNIIKYIKHYLLHNSVEDYKVNLRTFPGERVRYMENYVTVDHPASNQRKEIAKSIAELAPLHGRSININHF